ncbi:MAG: SDR family oxidoreductase [Thermodesulfobacteriota bacterium]|nr:SDR family oxidoreductase [Thermodesulfobacteriota bacterium]
MKNLKGRNALLTGGSRGLGPVIAEALAGEGINIALAARSEEELKKVAENLSSYNISTVAIPADITDEASLLHLVEKTLDTFSTIDILVNNAGIEWVSRYVSLSTEYIGRIIKTNLMGPMLLTRLVMPHMLERKSGHIVTMSSLGGKKGSPYSATYAATKAGLVEWTSGLRQELKGTGVGASVICPGFVSNVGMFAVYNKRAPKIVGETTPEKVANAVIRAIEKDIQEVIVSPGLIIVMKLLDAIHPAIMSTFLRYSGVYDFYRGQADDNEKN